MLIQHGKPIFLSNDNWKPRKIDICLKWQAKKSLLPFFKSDVDLDLMCLCFDRNRHLVDRVYFNNSTSQDKAIYHKGGGSNMDRITVSLDKVQHNISALFLVFTSFSQSNLKRLCKLECEITDRDTETDFARLELPHPQAMNGMLVLKFNKVNTDWVASGIAEVSETGDVDDLINLARRFLTNR